MVRANVWPLRKLKNHLRERVSIAPQHGWLYRNLADFVLKQGQTFTPRPLPRKFRGTRARPQECFNNSFSLAANNNLVYVEGYATRALPVHHAWCVEPGSALVIDPTWSTPGTAYFGVAFDLLFVARYLLAFGLPVLNSWREGFPILRGLIPKEVWGSDGKRFDPRSVAPQ